MVDKRIQSEAVRFQVGCVWHGGQQVYVQVVYAVAGHRQVERFGQMRDFYPGGDAANVRDIGFRKRYRAPCNHLLEFVKRVQILPCRNGQAALAEDAHMPLDVVGNRQKRDSFQQTISQREQREPALWSRSCPITVRAEMADTSR